MSDGMILVDALRDPESTTGFDAARWTDLLTIARAEMLIGSLAGRLEGQPMPDSVAAILSDARINAEYQRRSALWEADCAERALAEYDGKIVLMKGTAYVAADLTAGIGRSIGDLDIMVAEDDLREVEALLLGKGGWEWVKEDDYDDVYYREHMHELPPLIHKERDRMIDVHHTILPKTARQNPDAKAMLSASLPLSLEKEGDLYIFSNADMTIHCVAHLFADGDLAGGLRNLWDLHCLVSEFSKDKEDYWETLKGRAELHQLTPHLARALRLSHRLYGTNIDEFRAGRIQFADHLYIRRLTARNGRGVKMRKFTRLAFYIRSHWLRMPPVMLAKHLWIKWRKG